MISLLLPYWNRQDAADKALALIEEQYSDLDLEVIVIDDGSPVPFVSPKTSLNLRVIRLELKGEPKSPCLCWNIGAREAKGDIIVLSCIEVLHEKPVLGAMLAELKEPNDYVLAATYCPDTDEWHCHSTKVNPSAFPIPSGTGRAFCGMLFKSHYWAAGGWDEDYREGAGYEDVDWIYRLRKVGTTFKIRDDLVVIHPKKGATLDWGAAKFERNLKLLHKKWHVTFCCLQAGNYCGRGVEYVNKLFDMVARNYSGAFRFVCLTDNPEGLNPLIEVKELPSDLERWYGKLYFFKKGVFPEGERVVFMDLDTVIVGKLDDLIYDGPFATLTDFYFPDRVGPAVMMWRVSDTTYRVWDAWVEQGKPRNEMGDLWWLNTLDDGGFAVYADRLQKLYPGAFVSYKAHCRSGLPKGARVVCFHGRPRPHEVDDEWVAMAYAGKTASELETVSNTARETVQGNIRSACNRPLPWLEIEKPHDGEIAVVGGGPSLPEFLGELKGKRVIAVNGTHAYLLSKGIVPDHHLIIDARPENIRFLSGARHHFLASQCDPSLFDKAQNVTVVHMNTENVLDAIPPTIKPINLISSGSTVGLAGIAIAYCLGYRKIFVYGMDSSFEDSKHAYPQAQDDRVIEAEVGGRTFKTTPWMVAQAQQFQAIAAELANDGCEIYVRCRGLLGHVAWLMSLREAA